MPIPRPSIIALLLALGSAPAFAGQELPPASWEVEAHASGVAGSDFKGPKNYQDVEAIDTQLRAIASVHVRDGVLLRLGVELERFDFARPASIPIPHSLHSLAFVVGADLQIGQGWLMQLDLLPGFYGSNEAFSGNDFNIPVNLGASYFVSTDLQLVAGLSLDINRQYPLLPAVGVRWKLSHDWVLNAILPAPRFEYTVHPSLTFFAGADFRGDTFRVDDIAGSARRSRRLNNAIVDYTQIRVGGGTTWTIAPHVTFEFEAGVVPIQDFDYHRANTRVRSKETPPYAGVSIKADF